MSITSVDWEPSLRRRLVAVFIFARRVQYTDANFAALVDYWQEEGKGKMMSRQHGVSLTAVASMHASLTVGVPDRCGEC